VEQREKARQAREAILRLKRERKSAAETTQAETSTSNAANTSSMPATTGITVETIKPEFPFKTPDIDQLLSQTGFPQHDTANVRRSNTYSGPPRSQGRNGSNSESAQNRTIQRITRRLGDMGFTEVAYPTMVSKIRAQMPSSGVVTKDVEDDIVTNMLEELLAMGPSASGSGPKNDIPGAWN
jgi:Wiskott-Aldrich syndrome protein